MPYQCKCGSWAINNDELGEFCDICLLRETIKLMIGRRDQTPYKDVPDRDIDNEVLGLIRLRKR
jgi:hypothetical protein